MAAYDPNEPFRRLNRQTRLYATGGVMNVLGKGVGADLILNNSVTRMLDQMKGVNGFLPSTRGIASLTGTSRAAERAAKHLTSTTKFDIRGPAAAKKLLDSQLTTHKRALGAAGVMSGVDRTAWKPKIGGALSPGLNDTIAKQMAGVISPGFKQDLAKQMAGMIGPGSNVMTGKRIAEMYGLGSNEMTAKRVAEMAGVISPGFKQDLAKQVASVMGPGSNMMTAKRFAEMYGGIGRVEAAAIQGVARLAGAYGFDRTAVSHLARMTAGYAGIDKARIAGLTGMRGFDTSALRAMGILGVRTDLLRGLYGRLVFSEAELRSVMDATRSFRAYDSAAPQRASHELAVDLEVAVIEFGLLRWFLQLPWTAHAAVAMEVIGTAFAIADSVMLSVCDEGLPPQVTSYNGSAGHVIALILLMHGLAMKWRADNDAY